MPIPSSITELRESEKNRALQLLRSLPSLKHTDTQDPDACCPICLISFETIFEDEEHVVASQRGSSPQHPSSSQAKGEDNMYGIVKLVTCGHVFCRKDIAEWVESFHGSCPACRQVFFEFTPIDEAEYESSDGGEYIPDDDDFEEDDFFTDDDLIPSSDFLDTDIEVEDEDEIEASFTLANEHNGSEVTGSQFWDDSSVYGDVSDIEVEDDGMPEFAVLDEYCVPELDGGMSSENDSSLFASEGLTTDGANSISSDTHSLETRHNDSGDELESHAADVSMVSADIGASEDCIRNIKPMFTKEPGAPSMDVLAPRPV